MLNQRPCLNGLGYQTTLPNYVGLWVMCYYNCSFQNIVCLALNMIFLSADHTTQVNMARCSIYQVLLDTFITCPTTLRLNISTLAPFWNHVHLWPSLFNLIVSCTCWCWHKLCAWPDSWCVPFVYACIWSHFNIPSSPTRHDTTPCLIRPHTWGGQHMVS